jgi:hypothetical protein
MRAILLSLALAPLCHAAGPPVLPRFPLGRATTFFTGPLDHRGYVNYAAALHARMTRGLKPEDNAAVTLWRAFGPRPEGGLVAEAHFTAIGMKRPPQKGSYLISLGDYNRDTLRLKGQALEGLYAQHTRASSRAWTAKELPRMAGWVKANEKQLALVLEATKSSRYYTPLIPPEGGDLIGALLPAAQKCREAASLLVARAMLNLGEGRHDEAWRDLLACHRLGRLAGQGNTLIEGLVGMAIESIACRATAAYIERARPDGKRIARCLADLGKLPPMTPMADKVDVVDRVIYLDSVRMLAQGGAKFLEALGGGALPWAGEIDYTPALKLGNEWFDRLTAAMRAPTRRERLERSAAIEADLKKLRPESPEWVEAAMWVMGGPSWRGKKMGAVLVRLLVPATAKVRTAEDRVRQAHANLLVAFALEAYRRDRGAYPEKLSALAPRHIRALPGDIFSGGELAYRREGKGYLLHSIGPDGKDDGGRGPDDDPPGDDIAVRMPQKE